MSVLIKLNEIGKSNDPVNRIIVERAEKPSVKVLQDGALKVCIPNDGGSRMYDLLTVAEHCAEFDEHVGSSCTKYQMLIHNGTLHVDIRPIQRQMQPA